MPYNDESGKKIVIQSAHTDVRDCFLIPIHVSLSLLSLDKFWGVLLRARQLPMTEVAWLLAQEILKF